MRRDPLQVLHRLRQASVDEASHALAQALAEEQAAESDRRTLFDSIGMETDRAAASDGDVDVERFAAWLRRTRTLLDAAEHKLAAAAAQTAARRAELALARAGAEAAIAAIERQAELQRRALARVEQQAYDEMGRRRPR